MGLITIKYKRAIIIAEQTRITTEETEITIVIR